MVGAVGLLSPPGEQLKAQGGDYKNESVEEH
jgi:hypothetical protein